MAVIALADDTLPKGAVALADDQPLGLPRAGGDASYLGASARAALPRFAQSTLEDAAFAAHYSPGAASTVLEMLHPGTKARNAADIARVAAIPGRVADRQMENLSPEAQDTADKKYATLDPSKAAYLSGTRVTGDVVQNLPTLLLSLVAPALRARTLAAAGGKAAMKAAASQFALESAGTEGAIGYGQEAAAARQRAAQAQGTDGTDILSQAAAERAGVIGGAVDAATELVGGKVLGRVLTEGGRFGARVLKGAANQGVTEAVQGAGEQVGENYAIKSTVDPTVDLFADVPENVVSSGVVGAAMGGGVAGPLGRSGRETGLDPTQDTGDAGPPAPSAPAAPQGPPIGRGEQGDLFTVADLVDRGIKPEKDARPQVEESLSALLTKYDGDKLLALTALKAGPGNVDSWVKRFGYDPAKPQEFLDQIAKVGSPHVAAFPKTVMEAMGAPLDGGGPVDEQGTQTVQSLDTLAHQGTIAALLRGSALDEAGNKLPFDKPIQTISAKLSSALKGADVAKARSVLETEQKKIEKAANQLASDQTDLASGKAQHTPEEQDRYQRELDDRLEKLVVHASLVKTGHELVDHFEQAANASQPDLFPQGTPAPAAAPQAPAPAAAPVTLVTEPARAPFGRRPTLPAEPQPSLATPAAETELAAGLKGEAANTVSASEKARTAILDRILGDPETRDPMRRLVSQLKRAGLPADISAVEAERIGRYEAARDAFHDPEQPDHYREAAAPDESGNFGIPERATPEAVHREPSPVVASEAALAEPQVKASAEVQGNIRSRGEAKAETLGSSRRAWFLKGLDAALNETETPAPTSPSKAAWFNEGKTFVADEQAHQAREAAPKKSRSDQIKDAVAKLKKPAERGSKTTFNTAVAEAEQKGEITPKDGVALRAAAEAAWDQGMWDALDTAKKEHSKGPAAKKFDVTRRGLATSAIGAAAGAVHAETRFDRTQLRGNEAVMAAVKTGKLTNVVQAIHDTTTNPAHKEIARLMLLGGLGNASIKVVDTSNENVGGDTETTTGNVTIFRMPNLKFNGFTEETILHESLHSFLAQRYHGLSAYSEHNRALAGTGPQNADQFVKQFQDIWRAFSDMMEAKHADLIDKEQDAKPSAEIWATEAWRDPDELFVRVHTDPDLQTFLKSIDEKGDAVKSGAPSWWDKLMKFFAGILGIKTHEQITAFSQIMSSANSVLKAAALDKPTGEYARKLTEASKPKFSRGDKYDDAVQKLREENDDLHGYLDRLDAAQKALRQQLDRLGLHDIAAKVVPKTFLDLRHGGNIQGTYTPLEGIIRLGLEAKNLNKTAYHEAAHALRHFDLFTPAEWRLMVHHGIDLIGDKTFALYKDEHPNVIDEEAAVEAWAMWANGQDTNPPNPVVRLFRKISGLVEAVRNAFQGNGFQTVEDVYGRIKRGEVGARERGQFKAVREGRYGDFRKDRFPEPIERANKAVTRTVAEAAKKGHIWLTFTEDLANMAKNFLPSASRLIELHSKNFALSRQFEERLLQIKEAYERLPAALKHTAKGSVNEFLYDSRMAGKWGFKPDYTPKAEIDKDLEQRFNRMPKPAQDVIKSVFRFNYDARNQLYKATVGAIDAEYDPIIAAAPDPAKAAEATAEKSRAMAHFSRVFDTREGVPYTPLKREGMWVVVGRSNEYAQAKRDNDQKTMDKLRTQPDHYFVDMRDTVAEAEALRDNIATKFGKANTVAFERSGIPDGEIGGPELYIAFQKLKAAVEGEVAASPGSKAAKELHRLATDLYLHTLSDTSARKGELRADLVPARDPVTGEVVDMMRAFVTRGQATTHYVSSISNNAEMQDALRGMREELSQTEGDDRKPAARFYNELLYRYTENLGHRPNRLIDKAARAVSFYNLLTVPMYYAQNATQAVLLSQPLLAGRVGYDKAAAAFTRAYADFAKMTKDIGIADRVDFAKAPADVRDVLQRLAERGRLDAGLTHELGSWQMNGDGIVPKGWNAVDRFFRQVPQRVEVMNRVVTGVAAYRTMLAKTKDPEAAFQYASKLIYDSHGDYSGFNAPTPFHALGNWSKIVLQFRKFQMIMASMLVKEFHKAFQGETKEVRNAARVGLFFTAAHMAAVGGAVGMPAASTLGWAIGMALTAVDKDRKDEYHNWQEDLRTWLGAGKQGDEKNMVADLLFKGAPYALLNADLSGKLGLGTVAALAPYSDADKALDSRDAYYQAIGQLLSGALGGVGAKAVDGWSYAQVGDVGRAVELMSPGGIAAMLKAHRLATQGVVNRTGDVTTKSDDITLLDEAMTTMGLTPRDLSDPANARSVAFEAGQHYDLMTTKLKREYITGDDAKKASVRDAWEQLQGARVRQGFKRQPMADLIKSGTAHVRREAQMRGGVETTPTNRRFVLDMMGDLEAAPQ